MQYSCSELQVLHRPIHPIRLLLISEPLGPDTLLSGTQDTLGVHGVLDPLVQRHQTPPVEVVLLRHEIHVVHVRAVLAVPELARKVHQRDEDLIRVNALLLDLAVEVDHVDHGQVALVEVEAAEVLEAVLSAARLRRVVEFKRILALRWEDRGEGDVATKKILR